MEDGCMIEKFAGESLVARRVVYLSYIGYGVTLLIGLFLPHKLEDAIQAIGGAIFSVVGGIDNRLNYSLTLVMVFTILELARNCQAFQCSIFAVHSHGNSRDIKLFQSGLFPLLIILYFVGTVVAVVRSNGPDANWHPIPNVPTFLIDLVTIWAVSFSIVNIFYLCLTAISSRNRS